MRIVKQSRKYCPKCDKHTIQTISIYKAGKMRKSAIGARHHAQDKKGYGGQKFPELKRKAKTTKKQVLKLKCKECSFQTMKPGIRLRKLEIIP